MFLDKKTLLKIWLNPGLNLTIFRGTGPWAYNLHFDVSNETQKERTYIYVIYIRYIFVSKWMGLYPGGFNVGFSGILNAISYLECMAAHSMNFCLTG